MLSGLFATTYKITQHMGTGWMSWKTYSWKFINDNTVQFDTTDGETVIVCGNFNITVIEK